MCRVVIAHRRPTRLYLQRALGQQQPIVAAFQVKKARDRFSRSSRCHSHTRLVVGRPASPVRPTAQWHGCHLVVPCRFAASTVSCHSPFETRWAVRGCRTTGEAGQAHGPVAPDGCYLVAINQKISELSQPRQGYSAGLPMQMSKNQPRYRAPAAADQAPI